MAGFQFDPGDITLDELEILEANGVNFGLFQQIGETGEMPTGAGYATTMRALAFIVNRRTDTTYTWADTGAMSLNQIVDLLDSVGEWENPTVPHAV